MEIEKDIYDIPASLTYYGMCLYCKSGFSPVPRLDKRFKCPNPECKKSMLAADCIIYAIVLTPALLDIHKTSLFYGREYMVSKGIDIRIGERKRIKYPRRFSNVQDVFFPVPYKCPTRAKAIDIRNDSFEIITSGTADTVGQNIKVDYSVHYIDDRYSYPMWTRYLQTVLNLRKSRDYYSAMINVTAALDAYCDSELRRKIKGYDVIVKRLTLWDKKELLKEMFGIDFSEFNKPIQNLLETRNRIAHGNISRVNISKNIFHKQLQMVFRIIYLILSHRYPGHPQRELLND